MDKLAFYVGPCVLESEELAREIAATLVKELTPLAPRIELTFKGSYDKANRSSLDSFRGPGLARGLKILAGIKEEFSLPLRGLDVDE